MSLASIKLLLAAATLAVGWAGGTLPLRLSGRGPGLSWIGVGNAFAAGLFLAVGLLHLLPESAARFRELEIDFPLASLLAMAAFLLMLLLEHVLLPDAGHEAAHAHAGQEHAGHAHAEVREQQGAPGSAAIGGASDRLSRPYLLVIALSVHSVLAGFALGTGPEAVTAGLTFAAVAVHKATAGLALGLALASSTLSRRRGRRLVALFATMTPLGIVVGIGAGELSDVGLFDPVAGALAAGTFLYIGAFDLSQDASIGHGRRWLQWLAAVFGVGLAALLTGLG